MRSAIPPVLETRLCQKLISQLLVKGAGEAYRDRTLSVNLPYWKWLKLVTKTGAVPSARELDEVAN